MSWIGLHKFADVIFGITPGCILESNGMHGIFQKKRAKKGQNIWKFGQKYTKLENILTFFIKRDCIQKKK